MGRLGVMEVALDFMGTVSQSLSAVETLGLRAVGAVFVDARLNGKHLLFSLLRVDAQRRLQGCAPRAPSL